MHTENPDLLRHAHIFLGHDHARNERRTWLVVGLSTVMMVAEIVGGMLSGSMALTADGWHMATHAGALGIGGLAYRFAARRAHDPAFAFGTGKVGDLAGFASAMILALIALLIGYQSFARMFEPVDISYREALAIAVLGLAVNIVSAALLGGNRRHDDHSGAHSHAHHDHNLRSAYLHVLADALTSLLAIFALLAAGMFGLLWMDAAVGLIGAAVIGYWAKGLIRESGAALLDYAPERDLDHIIRSRLETGDVAVSDLHLWRIGPGHMAAVVSLVTHDPQPPEVYKRALATIASLAHVTIEVNCCPDMP